MVHFNLESAPLKSSYRNPVEQEQVFNVFIRAVKGRLHDYSMHEAVIDKYSYPENGPGSWSCDIYLDGRVVTNREMYNKGVDIIRVVAKEHFPYS